MIVKADNSALTGMIQFDVNLTTQIPFGIHGSDINYDCLLNIKQI